MSQSQNKKKITNKVSLLTPYIVASTTIHIPGKQSLFEGTPFHYRQILSQKKLKAGLEYKSSNNLQRNKPKRNLKFLKDFPVCFKAKQCFNINFQPILLMHTGNNKHLCHSKKIHKKILQTSNGLVSEGLTGRAWNPFIKVHKGVSVL